MKEKNQYYSENVEFISPFYKPEGQITNQDYDLFLLSQKGDFNSISKFLNKIEFKRPILNYAIVNLVQNYKRDDFFLKCFKLLSSKDTSFNYKLAQKSNKTLLMVILEKEEFILFKLFLESLNDRINSIKILPGDKMEEYQISGIKKIFSYKDAFGNNFSHLFDTIDKAELIQNFSYLYYKFPFLG